MRSSKNIIRLFLWLIAAFPPALLQAQHQELNEQPRAWKDPKKDTDTSSLLAAFRRGHFNGHFRYFFMLTDNHSGLTDYYAHAAGGGIHFESGRFRNFQLGVSGSFVYNLLSSDLSAPDEKTRQPNRYETGLFDIEDLSNKKNINRLEELYLRFHFNRNTITTGKQLINTPFINLQDGRMRPTAVDAVWTDIRSAGGLRIQGGFIYGISPRSTVRWFRSGASIGIYPAGVDAQGIKSGYAGNLHSKGILLAGATWDISPKFKLSGWELFTENIFNSALLQADLIFPGKNNAARFASLQLVRQDAVHQGGHTDPSKTYLPKGASALAISTRTGWKNERREYSLNFTRITSAGRYLLPREWGRDPFFTFLPRERNEGFGDVTALNAKYSFQSPKKGVSGSAALGYYDLPDVRNYRLNKYGMPSYWQLNLEAHYKFRGWFKGLESQFLFVYKKKAGPVYGNDKYVINKVDMALWNLLFNYQF